jgi:hypothetical protein
MKFKISVIPVTLCVAVALTPTMWGVRIASPLVAQGSAYSFCASEQWQFLKAVPFDPSTEEYLNYTSVGGSVTSEAACDPFNSASVTSTAFAGISAVSGSVSVSASPSLGASGGVGEVGAAYTDTVTLNPPPGFTGSGVTFGVVANYDLEFGFTADTILAVAQIQLSVPGFNQNVSTLPVLAPFPGGVGNVSSTGLLQTSDMTFPSCPCTTEFTLGGSAEASGGNGTFASFSDPVSFILPPGWTYTLAYQQQVAAAAPEPNSGILGLIGLGVLCIAFVHWPIPPHGRTLRGGLPR